MTASPKRILIAEDSPTQRVELEYLLEEAGYKVVVAEDGGRAWHEIEAEPPDVVLTDLHMPELNGLELVERVRGSFSSVPVILMTADGTDEIAVKALKQGATSYIPKSLIEQDLISTVGDVVEMLDVRKNQALVYGALVQSESSFELDNDHSLASSLIMHFEDELKRLKISDDTGVLRITMAIKEALMNAIDHGNLELNSDLRDEDGDKYHQMGIERSQQDPWQQRRVYITSTIREECVTYRIRDEGPGFDPSKIPDPTDPENLIKAHGRGLMLIHSFMDEVSHSQSGNEITMIKYREKVEFDRSES